MSSMSTKRFVYLAILSALAIVLSLLESIYIGPIFLTLRLGLANIVALIGIKVLGVKETIIINIMRVMISTLLRGLIFGSTFWISLGGVSLSTIILILLDKLDMSLMFTSIMSSIAHSTGQIIVVCMFYNQPAVVRMLPFLLLGSIPMGMITGVIAKMVLARIKPLKKTIKTGD